MDGKIWLKTIITLTIILGATSILYLYTSGYRINKESASKGIDLQKTGMISAKSFPEGASVYVDGVLTTATNGTVSGVIPGTHGLKIYKKGFVGWSKNIEVFPELVTDITAILISQSPRLEPLTNTGAKYPSISPSLTKLAYFSEDASNPGIWVIPLSQTGLSLFKTNPFEVLKDTRTLRYSKGLSIEWSPDEKTLLIQDDNKTYHVVDLDTNTPGTTSSADIIRKDWTNTLLLKRKVFIEKLDLPDDIKALAVSTDSVWAPDEKKFLYTIQNGDQLEYHVYNMEKPIPIGEKAENIVFTTKTADPQPKISWYADSFHLILTEGDINANKRGTIYLIRIDGTNKTEIYNNSLLSNLVYSAPGGDKLIIVTSFKSGDQTDLYTVGIR